MLSNTCKYGIRAIIFIASRAEKPEKTGLKLIADELKIPQPYLAKILQTLVKKKILDSSKGPHGGFSIIRNISKLTLLDIIMAIDGEVFNDCCFITGGKCSFELTDKKHCMLHTDLDKERIRIKKYYGSKTIDGILKQMKRNPQLGI